MREHLIFLLAAPMASFGSYAGHERRGSELMPLRSMVLGLIGAALGVERRDTDAQTALRAYLVAVQPLQASSPLRDYQTVQTVKTANARRPTTRRSALNVAGRDANTIITKRDYRCDVIVGAALWGHGRWPLPEIAEALKKPHFTLYLGRKSCPLSVPLSPQVVQTNDPLEALSCIEVPQFLRHGLWQDQDRARHPVFSDPFDGRDSPPMAELLPNEPLSREVWTFAERTVWRLARGDEA